MTHYYSDPSREKEKYALPDVEVFYADEGDIACSECGAAHVTCSACEGERRAAGWYWWACFPGCMPEGDAIGPFDTEEDALADMREKAEP